MDETIGPMRRHVKAFLSHSGESQAFVKYEHYLRVGLGIDTIVVEWLPFHGMPVPENIQANMRESDFAVVFYEGKGKGMLIELGQLQSHFGNRIIYLVEEGQSFGPMADAYAGAHFKPDNLEEAYNRTVDELFGWGFIGVGTFDN